MPKRHRRPRNTKPHALRLRWDIAPLRLLSLVALVFMLGGLLFAGLLVDDRVNLALISLRERWIWAGALGVVLIGFFTIVTWYEHRVVMQLNLSDDGNFLRLTTPTLLGQRDHVIHCGEVTDVQVHRGDDAAEESWSPPWLKLQIRGRGAFVVPLSGIDPERQRLIEFFERCSHRPEPVFEALGRGEAKEAAAAQVARSL